MHVFLLFLELEHLLVECFLSHKILILQQLDLSVFRFQIGPHFICTMCEHLLRFLQVLDFETILIQVSLTLPQLFLDLLVLLLKCLQSLVLIHGVLPTSFRCTPQARIIGLTAMASRGSKS